jgi:hypothetical protein
MISLKISIDDKLTPRIKRQRKELDNLPQEAYTQFKAHTPIRSGNARRNTRLVKDDTILADYQYAQRLEDGYSRQAPDGMIKPVEAFVKKRLDNIFNRK